MEKWIEWWNSNNIPLHEKITYLDLAIIQNVEGAKEFNKWITDGLQELYKTNVWEKK